ncbi:hypothetical protein EDD11_009239 [Mortierella claussenii]|nr:hypothetical protein EDD11_009239 [Mortierella claussenii]
MTINQKVTEDTSVTFKGWATMGDNTLKELTYHPRPLGPKDVEIEITHCGVCGSDIHTISGGWGPQQNVICGHEVVGKIAVLGDENVSAHKIGDLVGVGALVHSCRQCKECKAGFDQFCQHKVFTQSDFYKDERGGPSYGGFADRIRLNSEFAFKIPASIKPAEATSLFCAGITTYAPLKQHGAGPGKKVGIIGIGGLGHIGLQWARALNCDEVVAISTSDNKREEAKKLGATKFVNLKKPEEVEAAAESMDLVLCTSFAKDQDWGMLLSLVANHGKMVLLALPEVPLTIPANVIVQREVSLVGSLIGGKDVTQEMLEFAAEKNVRPWIEIMSMSDPMAAIKKVEAGHPRYRVVMETEAGARA